MKTPLLNNQMLYHASFDKPIGNKFKSLYTAKDAIELTILLNQMTIASNNSIYLDSCNPKWHYLGNYIISPYSYETLIIIQKYVTILLEKDEYKKRKTKKYLYIKLLKDIKETKIRIKELFRLKSFIHNIRNII